MKKFKAKEFIFCYHFFELKLIGFKRKFSELVEFRKQIFFYILDIQLLYTII